jgi:YfiH family protein
MGDTRQADAAGAIWVPLPGAAAIGVQGGCSTRRGGVSPPPWASLNLSARVGDEPSRIAENLTRLSHATGLALDRAARIPLAHGARVHAVAEPGWAPLGDALITPVVCLPLAITVADCYPLYLAAPGRALAIAHCGWRGLAAGIVGATADALAQSAGVTPRQLYAWIGPGIGPCCYDLSFDDADRFPTACRRQSARASAAGRVAIDLAAFLALELRAVGIVDPNVVCMDRCTACESESFYSHRRDQGRSGRMLAWIVRGQHS